MRDASSLLATVVASAFALVIGGAVGAITTFSHRQLGVWGLVIALVIVAALIAGFRLVFDSRAIAMAAAIGVLGMIAALILLPGAGGFALVVSDATGWVWVIAPIVIATAVVLWPHRKQKHPAASE